MHFSNYIGVDVVEIGSRKKISKGQVEERRAVRDLQVQEQAEVRPDRGTDNELMPAWQVSALEHKD